MIPQASSRSPGNAAKTSPYTGVAVYLVTHFIPMLGHKNVLDWMHSSVMSLLNITPNKIAGSLENLTGGAIYVLGWGVFAALGAAVGAVFASKPVERAGPAAQPAESPLKSLPRPERHARSSRRRNILRL